MNKLHPNGTVTDEHIEQIPITPAYLYDEQMIVNNCDSVKSMGNAFGLGVSYAMKANSNLALLQLVRSQGLSIDASSENEVRRALNAGYGLKDVSLTSQEIPSGIVLGWIQNGLRFTVCSLRQFHAVKGVASNCDVPLSVRVHPGIGSGETITRDTGGKYSCFGVPQEELPALASMAREQLIRFNRVHYHIGSGGDPRVWAEAISLMLPVVNDHFPEATTLNCGGGLRVGRMPYETSANLSGLGAAAEIAFRDFYKDTGRKLRMEIEPGTFIVANAGYLITSVIDTKVNAESGYRFAICDGGMECNTRPLLYGSEHPFYVVSNGVLVSSEFGDISEHAETVVVGRCCESGDSQSLDEAGHIVPRRMALADVGDRVVVGGCGAYCSSMSPANYNSHVAAPEYLCRSNGRIDLVREIEEPEDLWKNEKPLQPLKNLFTDL